MIGNRTSDAELTPKLALDLEGGTQLILTPKTTDGSEITAEDVDQAIEIIRQRVDASGVSEAEITRQGQSNIVVGLPGEPSPETLDLIRRSAQLRFRPVLPAVVAGAETQLGFEPGLFPLETMRALAETVAGEDADALGEMSHEELATLIADADGDGALATEPLTTPASYSDPAWVTEQIMFDFLTRDCTDPASLEGGDQTPPDVPVVSCDSEGNAKYILGPTEIEGTSLVSASSGLGQTATGGTTNQWQVSLRLDSEAAQVFDGVTQRLMNLDPPQNMFGIVLDGLVVSAASVSVRIPNGEASISGEGITRESAATLANQLQFGSLPLNFDVQSEEQISATLGIQQLERGILAGMIGLVLVVLFMLSQYHALSIVSVASLIVAALMTYLAITVLGWAAGYRLSLAGVAGLIVAIGITADSFIVYFERIRDEVREGRTLEDALDFGWVRARSTIIAAGGVNLLAAIVLYFLAVGGVRGFAFTLGLTTVVDLIVAVLFTYPLMKLIVRIPYFRDGRKFSGLDPIQLGSDAPRYRGRPAPRLPSRWKPKSPDDAGVVESAGDHTVKKLSIAERKAARAAAEEVDA